MFSKVLKLSLVIGFTLSSFSLSSCGMFKRVATVEPAAEKVTPAANDFYQPPVDNTPVINTVTATPNTSLGTVKLTGWQPRGIAVSAGTMYLSAYGTTKVLFTSGTVLKVGADGKVKDLASNLVGYHAIAKTVTGLALSGSSLVVSDTDKMYTVDSTSGKVVTIKGKGGGTDVAVAGGNVFISNGSIEKSDSTVASRNPVSGLSGTGIGGDNTGNVYAVSGNSIKKAGPDGQVMDVVTSDLSAPLDVAVDNRNGDIYVLEMQNVKRFNSSGALLTSFPSMASKPIAIAVDELGIVYVADNGNDAKDSKVVKFSASVG